MRNKIKYSLKLYNLMWVFLLTPFFVAAETIPYNNSNTKVRAELLCGLKIVEADSSVVKKKGKKSRKAKKSSKTLEQENISDTTTQGQKLLDTLEGTDIFEQFKSTEVLHGADRVKQIVDSLKKAGVRIDSLSLDSLSRRFFSDSVVVKGGVLPFINTGGSISSARILDSIIFAETLAANKAANENENKRVNVFRDSISFGRFGLLTTILPGYGQVYNKDYWKLPVLYGGVAACVWGGMKTGDIARQYKNSFDLAVKIKHQERIDYYHGKYRDYKTASSLLYVGAIATYMGFMADAAFGYKWGEDTKNRATYLGLMFPGGGQIYNKQYWKLPIVYGGFATMAYIINFNGRGYTRYGKAFELAANGLPHEFSGNSRVTLDVLRNTKNQFRRARDLAIFYTAGFYLLTVLDAYVSASFKQYDISDNLAMEVAPLFDVNNYGSTQPARFSNNMPNGVYGVTMKFTF